MEALNEQVVHFHEQAHEGLFTTTIDGCLLATLWTILDRQAQGDGNPAYAAFAATSESLLATSRDAHEIVATYYGVKMTDAHTHAGEIAKLPREYLNYFMAARRVIDKSFRSSFLQVRVIQAVAQFTFRSRFALRFLADPLQSYVHLANDEKADWRIRQILDHLRRDRARALRSAVDSCAADFFEEQGMQPWNLDQDSDWQVDPFAAFRLDIALDACVDAWLISTGLWPSIDRVDLTDAFDRLIVFASDFGVRLVRPAPAAVGASDSTPGALLQQFLNDGAVRARARTQSGSIVSNDSVEPSLPVLRPEALWEIDDFRLADSLEVVGLPSPQSSYWTVVCRGRPESSANVHVNGVPVIGARFGRADTIRWLNAMVDPGDQHWQGPIPDVIVIPIGNESLTGPRSFSLDGEQAPGAVDSRLNAMVALYVVDSWADAIDIGLSDGGRVDTTELHIQMSGFGDEPVTLHVNVARGDAFPGNCIFRIFSESASHDSVPLVYDWEANPEFRRLSSAESEAEAAFDLDFVEKAARAVVALWHQF